METPPPTPTPPLPPCWNTTVILIITGLNCRSAPWVVLLFLSSSCSRFPIKIHVILANISFITFTFCSLSLPPPGSVPPPAHSTDAHLKSEEMHRYSESSAVWMPKGKCGRVRLQEDGVGITVHLREEEEGGRRRFRQVFLYSNGSGWEPGRRPACGSVPAHLQLQDGQLPSN